MSENTLDRGLGRGAIRNSGRVLAVAGALSSAALFLGAPTFAAESKVYRLQGEIIELTPDGLTVEDQVSNKQLEFARARKEVRLPSELKVGDHVNLWYVLDANKLHLVRNPGGPVPQAGQVAPEIEIVPAPVPIRDDRIYLDAGAAPAWKKGAVGSAT